MRSNTVLRAQLPGKTGGIPVNGQRFNPVGIVEVEDKYVVGVEAEAFIGNAQKILCLGAADGYVGRYDIALRREAIHCVVDVGEAVDERIPDGFAKFPERTQPALAQRQKMDGGVGSGQPNHAGRVEVVVGREKSEACAFARKVADGFLLGSLHDYIGYLLGKEGFGD